MRKIEPARLKQDASADAIATPDSRESRDAAATIVRGRALIFWDLKIPDNLLWKVCSNNLLIIL